MLDTFNFCVYYITCVREKPNEQHNIICASGSVVEHLLAKEGVAGSIPVSRLKKERYQIGIVLFFEPCQGSKVRCLRSAPVRAVRGPPDLVRRLALLLFVAEALILRGFRYFCVCMKL